jgi:hypothetical protein
MEMQIGGVSGRGTFELGGATRFLACDMRAAESLYGAVGELWPYWMVERCVGSVYEIDGQTIRVADQMPSEELATLLIALLASDRSRSGRIDTVKSILDAIGPDGLLEAQQAATYVVQPCFAIPGKGLVKEKRRRARKRKAPWDWKRVLEVAFGPLGLRPEVFWSLTLVEWHMLQNGYAESERIDMRKRAWQSRYQLIAGGAKPEDVTISNLLGERDRKPRRAAKQTSQPSIREMWEQFQRLGEERKKRIAEIGEEAVKSEEEAALKKARDSARRKFERQG